MYGHIAQLAQAEKKGIEEAGGSVDIYQYVSFTQPLQPVLSTPHGGACFFLRTRADD